MTEEAVQERPPEINHVPKFLGFMFFYLCLVYACTLNIYPMGRDYQRMSASESAYSNGIIPWTFLETFIWKDWLPGYHLVNLALLYGCMVAIFFLTRHIVRGPWWMGSLAATLFMANPVKSEAVLNLSGIQDLLPAFLALVSLAYYAAHVRKPAAGKYLFSVVLFVPGMYWASSQISLFLAYVLIELIIVERAERRLRRLVPLLLLALYFGSKEYASLLNAPARAGNMWDPLGMLLPLCLIPYPIGFLPETLDRLQGHYTLVITYGLIMIAGIIGLAHASRHRAFVFGILGAVCLRLFQGNNPFNMVHMIGGGQLLLPLAFMSIAFAALVHRVIQHPKWLRPMVFLTAVLCVVFFCLQFQMNMIWRYAGQQVQAFQHEYQQVRGQYPRAALAILPNYISYRGAPLDFLQANARETPFSNLACGLLHPEGEPLLSLSRHGKEWYEIKAGNLSDGRLEIDLTTEGGYLPKFRANGYNAHWKLFSPNPQYSGNGLRWDAKIHPTGLDGIQRFTLSSEEPIVEYQLSRPWIDW